MKKELKARHLLVFLLCASLLPISSFAVIAAKKPSGSNYLIAQKQSDYDKYMSQGYTWARRRQYRRALAFFEQALSVRPGDKFAIAAIQNMKGYISRNNPSRVGFYVGAPGRTVAGGSRGTCKIPEGQRIIALTPTRNEAVRTTAEYPAFFVYIPKISNAKRLEFQLKDNDTFEELHTISLNPSQEAGIIRVNLPASANKPLKPEREYIWRLTVVCSNQETSDVTSLEGFIVRVVPDQNLTSQVENASPFERIALYATAGYWEDSLRVLGDLRRQRPNDANIKRDWQDFLSSVGFDKKDNGVDYSVVIKAPLLP